MEEIFVLIVIGFIGSVTMNAMGAGMATGSSAIGALAGFASFVIPPIFVILDLATRATGGLGTFVFGLVYTGITAVAASFVLATVMPMGLAIFVSLVVAAVWGLLTFMLIATIAKNLEEKLQ